MLEPQDQPPTPEHPRGLTTRLDGSGRELTEYAKARHAEQADQRARRVAELNLMGAVGEPGL